jgi:hypothetical protein
MFYLIKLLAFLEDLLVRGLTFCDYSDVKGSALSA